MFLNVLIRFQVTMCESELLIPLSRFYLFTRVTASDLQVHEHLLELQRDLGLIESTARV